jgi:hypothetical protein
LDADAVAFASRALDEASVAFKWQKVFFSQTLLLPSKFQLAGRRHPHR